MAFTAEQISDAYAKTGSVWAAGKLLGVSGQNFHQHMRKHGIPSNKRYITDADRDAIREYYQICPRSEFDLAALASSIGRTKALVCREARAMGVTDNSRSVNDERRKAIKDRASVMWKVHPHPRGSLGMQHSDETKAVISEKSKLLWATCKAFGKALSDYL